MSDIYKIEALIVLANKASDDIAELFGLVKKLGRIELRDPTPLDIKKYNILATSLNLLREAARSTSLEVKKNITIEVAEPDR